MQLVCRGVIGRVWLGHNRQREIVAVATLVVYAVSVAVDREAQAIDKIGESSNDRRSRGIVYYGENRAGRKRAIAEVLQPRLRSRVNRNAICDNFVRLSRWTV